ncbi:MAG TPA: TadE/TadG family type IV pilus assembly protein [Methylophilaceae bacterium]|nr:TadE/TadG family type IV pilus assembly protein [Methylophilaceae bacterium]
MNTRHLKSQKGLYLIEFALISGAFFLTIFVIIDMARVFYLLNAASEATRYGARVAAVCDVNDPQIKTSMINRIGSANLATGEIDVSYFPAGCSVSNCETLTVSLTNVSFSTILGFTVNAPDFATTLPRESMNSANNSICT